MKLWLDDSRNPEQHNHPGWHWVRTAEEAIAWLKADNFEIDEISLDHDLGVPSCRDCRMSAKSEEEYSKIFELGCVHGEKTGYEVILWLEQNLDHWPQFGVHVHSMNPAGRFRMQQAIDKIQRRLS